ncbi:hypothetical protein SAMN04487983_102193 [Streptomyces sp. yr375]|uniref:DUF6924 domain-containing protein n=1 Tax=Streptomyces sp. yr375 TaxID=1761906 RepID=UPI0008BD5E9F|nr:hypothetical protein [Streptomyces sp. yr375]SER75063.1 hypothetical protein SAMN04487983_102193 [Streptomyces sp. yr375]
MPLPRPDDLTSLVLRVDFDDDTAWHALRTALDALDGGPHATWVSDPRYEGVGIPELMREDNAADEHEQLTHLFLADAHAMAGAEHSLLALDLYDEPGRTFRVPARWFAEISADLSIANLDFEDYADSADASGVFRGFGDGCG